MAAKANDARNLLTSLVLVFPLFLVYQLGVLYTYPLLNGADLLTVALFGAFGLDEIGYLTFTAGVAAVFLISILILRRTQVFHPKVIGPVILESALYALTMGSAIILLMTKVLGLSPKLAAPGAGASPTVLTQDDLPSRVIMSLGAGVWEETVFRLFLAGALVLFFEKVAGLGRRFAVVAAFVLSSLAFSAMHHVGPYGDPLLVGVFTFRVLAGLCFATLYWTRGFAVAVYTHAFYDIWVTVLR